MNSYLNEAKEQLKRTDHLLYVSLKYTRTVDVLERILERLIECYYNSFMALLELAKEKEKIEEIPSNRLSKLKTVEEIYNHKEIIEHVKFYMMLRKIDAASPIKSNEFRRGVRMSVILGKVVVEVDIDTIEEYFRRAEAFLRIAQKIVEHSETECDVVLEEVIRGVHIDLEFERN